MVQACTFVKEDSFTSAILEFLWHFFRTCFPKHFITSSGVSESRGFANQCKTTIKTI